MDIALSSAAVVVVGCMVVALHFPTPELCVLTDFIGNARVAGVTFDNLNDLVDLLVVEWTEHPGEVALVHAFDLKLSQEEKDRPYTDRVLGGITLRDFAA